MASSVDVTESLRTVVARERLSGFPGLAGARLTVRVPVALTRINLLLKNAPFPPSSPIKAASLQLPGGNRGILVLQVERWPFPRSVAIPFLWDPTISVPADPVLRVILEPSGLLAPLVSLALSAISLPLGVRAEGRTIAFDLRALLASKRCDDLLTLTRKGRLTAEAGKLWLELDLAIDPKELSKP